MVQWLHGTSKVPALREGYFASEMNARKSLGTAVRGTWS